MLGISTSPCALLYLPRLLRDRASLARPAPGRLGGQTLADESVDLLAEEVALLASHVARKRVPSSQRPIGHDWVYSSVSRGCR